MLMTRHLMMVRAPANPEIWGPENVQTIHFVGVLGVSESSQEVVADADRHFPGPAGGPDCLH